MNVWQCSAPLRTSLRLPFPTIPLVIFCVHLLFHFLLFWPVSLHVDLLLLMGTPKFLYGFHVALWPCWLTCCLDTRVGAASNLPFGLMEVRL
jgi:hypothetical protein